MLCFCGEPTQILFYLEDLMTHMGDPVSPSVSLRLPVLTRESLHNYKYKRAYCFDYIQMVNESIASKCCNHKIQKQYHLQTNSYYINDKNNNKDEINSCDDANNMGNNDDDEN